MRLGFVFNICANFCATSSCISFITSFLFSPANEISLLFISAEYLLSGVLLIISSFAISSKTIATSIVWKLSSELVIFPNAALKHVPRINGNTIYILDEPTTGLHQYDIERLMIMINKIIEAGATAIIIEHNLDVIKLADHIIDLGPNGGIYGGQVVATGTPEEVAQVAESKTGMFLKKKLNIK